MRDPCYLKLRTPGSIEVFPWQFARRELPVPSENLSSGKWLLFRRCSTVVVDWKKICEEISKCNLWLAKVSLSRRNKSERLTEDVAIDLGPFEEIVGIEVLGASKHLEFEKSKPKVILENVQAA